jgi:hypothetical protein
MSWGEKEDILMREWEEIIHILFERVSIILDKFREALDGEEPEPFVEFVVFAFRDGFLNEGEQSSARFLLVVLHEVVEQVVEADRFVQKNFLQQDFVELLDFMRDRGLVILFVLGSSSKEFEDGEVEEITHFGSGFEFFVKEVQDLLEIGGVLDLYIEENGN